MPVSEEELEVILNTSAGKSTFAESKYESGSESEHYESEDDTYSELTFTSTLNEDDIAQIIFERFVSFDFSKAVFFEGLREHAWVLLREIGTKTTLQVPVMQKSLGSKIKQKVLNERKKMKKEEAPKEAEGWWYSYGSAPTLKKGEKKFTYYPHVIFGVKPRKEISKDLAKRCAPFEGVFLAHKNLKLADFDSPAAPTTKKAKTAPDSG
jgi:hypothetical protein